MTDEVVHSQGVTPVDGVPLLFYPDLTSEYPLKFLRIKAMMGALTQSDYYHAVRLHYKNSIQYPHTYRRSIQKVHDFIAKTCLKMLIFNVLYD